jgi:hypothetical protein
MNNLLLAPTVTIGNKVDTTVRLGLPALVVRILRAMTVFEERTCEEGATILYVILVKNIL